MVGILVAQLEDIAAARDEGALGRREFELGAPREQVGVAAEVPVEVVVARNGDDLGRRELEAGGELVQEELGGVVLGWRRDVGDVAREDDGVELGAAEIVEDPGRAGRTRPRRSRACRSGGRRGGGRGSPGAGV